MLYINNKFEEIDRNEIDFDVEKHLKNMAIFIENMNVDEYVVTEINENLNNCIIQFAENGNYKVKYNNDEFSLKMRGSAAAGCCPIEQNGNNEGFNMKYGIVFRTKELKEHIHHLTHESFHLFSAKNKLPYDENGINYTKSGIEINYYNSDDKLIDNSLNAEGLNEGITELLTQKYLLDGHDDTYLLQTTIARILTKNDTSLLNAYFSRNDQEVKKFYDKFDNSQNVISSNELISMSSNIIFDEQLVFDLLKGAITYDLNMITPDKLEQEITELKQIVAKLDSDFDYELDDSISYTQLVDDVITSSTKRTVR